MKHSRVSIFLIAYTCMVFVHASVLYSREKIRKPEAKGSGMIFNKDIFILAEQNTFFRKELVTGKHSQIVLMSIPVGGEIGMERHNVDQTLVFVQGHGQASINGHVSDVYTNHLVFVPAGAEHNFKNVGTQDLKLFTVYAPPAHKPGTVEKHKVD